MAQHSPVVLSFIFCILSLFVFEQVKATCADTQELNSTTDGYQFSANKWNPFDGDYKEWWFFTVSDTTTGLAWCMGYSVSNPTNTKSQMSGIAGINFVTQAENIQNIQDIYNYSDFSAAHDSATVSIGSQNQIKVINETTYSVQGATQDGSLQWNLMYHQVVPACRETMNIAVVELDWMSYMPTAIVEGYIVYNGNKVAITNGHGYHDHNWGIWPTSDFNWVWAQYGDASQDFAFVMGSYKVLGTKEYIGYAFVRVNGTKTKIGTLCMDSYSLTPLKFEKWQGHEYSVSNHVVVKGSEWWLEVEYTALSSGPNPGGRGLNLLVFEQISQFNVTLSKSDGNGGWNTLVQSSGLGFNEWSDIIKI